MPSLSAVDAKVPGPIASRWDMIDTIIGSAWVEENWIECLGLECFAKVVLYIYIYNIFIYLFIYLFILNT